MRCELASGASIHKSPGAGPGGCAAKELQIPTGPVLYNLLLQYKKKTLWFKTRAHLAGAGADDSASVPPLGLPIVCGGSPPACTKHVRGLSSGSPAFH